MNDEVDDLNMLPGSQTYAVAHLGLGQMHSISRSLDEALVEEISETIGKNRRNLSHSATAMLSRIKQKLPERSFTVNTGVLLAADNRLYICAVIQRVK